MDTAESVLNIDERYLVPGLQRGLAILELFGETGQIYTITEIAEKLGVNRSSSFRLVYTLEACGYLRKSIDGRGYTLDARVMDLGFKYLSSLDLVEAARPILTQLRDNTAIACHLVVLQGIDIVYIDQCQAQGSFTSRVRIGTRWPAFATVIGQLLLSDLPTEEVINLYKGMTEWPRYSELTPTNLEELLARLESVKGRSSLISWGHFNKSMATCASPVYRIDDERMVAVISVSCPTGLYSYDKFSGEICAHVVKSADMLSKRLTTYNFL